MPNRKPTGLPPGPRHNYTGQQNADRALNMRLTPAGWKALDRLAKANPDLSRAKIVSDALIACAFALESVSSDAGLTVTLLAEEQPPQQDGRG